MPYIGKSPLHGNYQKLDDFSGDFDGSDATHALAQNSLAITPVTEAALIISINGVIQEPVTDYTVSGTNITFTTAPASGANFFGVVLGEQLAIGTPSDATVTSAKLSGDITLPGKLTAAGDTASGDNASIGYTAGEGLILTGQGSTNDVTIKNDADADVITIATGTTNVDIVGHLNVGLVTADSDTSAGMNATMGYTSTEGLILTGQGGTNDITFKNDADTVAMKIETGSTTLKIVGNCLANTFSPEGDTSAGASSQLGYTSAEGLILTGQGSTNDVTIKNDADADVLRIPTGTTNVTLAGTLTVTSNISCTGNVTVNGLIFDHETMDIYDQGTWSPVLRPYTTVFDSITYDAVRQGHYVIIGKLCWFDWSMRTDAITVGSGSGNMNIFGLPVAGSDNDNHYKSWFVTDIGGSWAGEFPSSAQQHGQATYMALQYNSDLTTASAPLEIADCDTGANKNWSSCNGCYETA